MTVAVAVFIAIAFFNGWLNNILPETHHGKIYALIMLIFFYSGITFWIGLVFSRGHLGYEKKLDRARNARDLLDLNDKELFEKIDKEKMLTTGVDIKGVGEVLYDRQLEFEPKEFRRGLERVVIKNETTEKPLLYDFFARILKSNK